MMTALRTPSAQARTCTRRARLPVGSKKMGLLRMGGPHRQFYVIRLSPPVAWIYARRPLAFQCQNAASFRVYRYDETTIRAGATTVSHRLTPRLAWHFRIGAEHRRYGIKNQPKLVEHPIVSGAGNDIQPAIGQSARQRIGRCRRHDGNIAPLPDDGRHVDLCKPQAPRCAVETQILRGAF